MEDQSAIIKIGEVAKLLKMDIRSVRNMVDNGTIKTLPGKTKTRLFSRSYILRVIEGTEEKCPHCGEKL